MKLALSYLGVVFIWATTPLAIQWSGQDDWFLGVAGRILISALLIIPILLWVTRRPVTLQLSALKVYGAAALGMLGGMTPMYYAAQTMPSGWISLIFGLTPMLIGLFAACLLNDNAMTLKKWTGILVSFSGLALVVAPQWTTQFHPHLGIGVALALLAAASHSMSTVLVKRFNRALQLPNTHIVAAAVWLTSLVYLLIAPDFVTQLPRLSPQSLGAILYLGVLGSLLGFILYYYVLHHVDAVRIGLIPLITPVMALLLGYFLNNEPLTPTIAAGAGLVVFGLLIFEFGQHLSPKTLRLLASRWF
jgi:drug/metabolite transporter (DMT)-like permease